jgi:hypothetical protein
MRKVLSIHIFFGYVLCCDVHLSVSAVEIQVPKYIKRQQGLDIQLGKNISKYFIIVL